MARIELKFIDCFTDRDYIKTSHFKVVDAFDLKKVGIEISGKQAEEDFCICLDKSTAIKFAKTLRTEINKIQ